MEPLKKITELEDTILGIGQTKGYEYSQVMSSETAYIYKIVGLSVFEVFKRIITPVCIDSETEYKEIYPHLDHGHGLIVWTYSDFDKAIEKFNSL